jgi:hypothetical protein
VLAGGGGSTLANLADVDDLAPRFGYEDVLEARFDDDVHDVRALDAVRIAPESGRAFEAGPNGLDLLVFGPRRPADGVMDPDFWPA